MRKGDVPSAEQGKELKKTLDDALKTQDAIDNLFKSEKDLMIQVVQASLQLQLIYFSPKKPGDKEKAMPFLLQVQ